MVEATAQPFGPAKKAVRRGVCRSSSVCSSPETRHRPAARETVTSPVENARRVPQQQRQQSAYAVRRPPNRKAEDARQEGRRQQQRQEKGSRQQRYRYGAVRGRQRKRPKPARLQCSNAGRQRDSSVSMAETGEQAVWQKGR